MATAEPEYAFYLVLMGSMAEGTKIGYPDHFTYRLDVLGLGNMRVDFDESKPQIIDVLMTSPDKTEDFDTVMNNFFRTLEQAADELKQDQPGTANNATIDTYINVGTDGFATPCIILSWKKTEDANPSW